MLGNLGSGLAGLAGAGREGGALGGGLLTGPSSSAVGGVNNGSVGNNGSEAGSGADHDAYLLSDGDGHASGGSSGDGLAEDSFAQRTIQGLTLREL